VKNRIACRAVFLDAGGVLVLPDRHLLAGALAEIGIEVDPDAVPRAHYRAVRAFDRVGHPAPWSEYPSALMAQLGVVPARTADAVAVWDRLGARRRSGVILWSEPYPDALPTIAALRRAGLTVVIVTNSDGHAEENLADCGFAGVPVVDSEVVGSAKPDSHIFEVALARAGGRVRPAEVVHVGDTVANDVAGARAAAITPIHFDPFRDCRATDHRHIRTLAGIWRHVVAAGALSVPVESQPPEQARSSRAGA
jgi:putative hydrolase of the HAD superfamily